MTEPQVRDLSGPCVVCQQGTDTALDFDGPAEYQAGCLLVLGVQEDLIGPLVEKWHEVEYGAPPGTVIDGDTSMPVSVCAECVSKCPASHVFPAPKVAALGVPVIRPKRKS